MDSCINGADVGGIEDWKLLLGCKKRPVRHVDECGFLSVVFKGSTLQQHGIDFYFLQEFHSWSAAKE
jgi:dTDP-4-dehydrorhamnose 3,5-epimerase-like enzyme